ncbi:MAG TPA: metallophosphoesterase [Verrucomicrobiae bacterium]|nr:metallophosphoesterase [Verrucomicrobiae bacterium]
MFQPGDTGAKFPDMMRNVIGTAGRLFGEAHPGADETTFQVDNTSEAYYHSPYYRLHKNQLQPVPSLRTRPPRICLADVADTAFVDNIIQAGKIVFHAVGDTGAAKSSGPVTEARVADLMAADVSAGGPLAPAFFFHLGDVVYHFGEGQFYYDQFYEPFRAYDRPIFAIPGNHDGMVFGAKVDVPKIPTLQAFLRNFCAAAPGPSPDAGGLVRSVMTQPGVYFTLDAPFVSIIGLYSNVLEGPGVISSEGGKYPVPDGQLNFLAAELVRLKPLRQAGERAVILAVHHPPLSVDGKSGGTKGLSDDIDTACQRAGLWPDAVLSGHAHLYQRFTRQVNGRHIPYVVSGSGGFAATPPRPGVPPAPVTVGDVTLVKDPVVAFGYLTVTTDAKMLTITFRSSNPNIAPDSVTVDLQRGVIKK